MSYKPYWKRHPIQRRLVAIVTLPLLPFMWAAVTLWEARDELAYDFKQHVKAIKP